MSEIFDLSDIKLNLESQPPTSWGNLGYWTTPNQTYAKAAEALARLHADAAELNSSSRLLDLAFGCGDQLRVWQQNYQPTSIKAVNISHSQMAWAKDNFAGSADCYHGDAVSFLSAQSNISADVILSVDSAYHFPNWDKFLQQASRVLAPRGCLAISILVENDRPTLKQTLLTQSLRLAGINLNSMNLAGTIISLKKQGMKVETYDISVKVFAGFSNWWKKYRKTYAAQWPAAEKRRYDVTSYWLRQAMHANGPRYILLVAKKAATNHVTE